MKEYLHIPDKCPCCGGTVEIVTSDSGVLNLKCNNNQCLGRLSNRIDHYLGKKGLDVKGMSMKTIEKLIDWGWLNGLTDIYRLVEHRVEWISKTGFGATSVGKILDTIESSKREVPLDNFISAIGVPLVGKRVAKEIVKYYPTWKEFRAAIGGDWTNFDGFGPELDYSLNTFDYTEADELATMLEFKISEANNDAPVSNAATNLTFCVTGKLISGRWKNRSELKSYIESIGGRVVDHISSKVDYLITNSPDNGTAKNTAARKNGIPIITEAKFIEKFWSE